MLDRPLSDFLKTLPSIPRYDPENSANWKGYRAAWEIKQSRLYLVEFKAKQKGKPVAITSLFPKLSLPIMASWYSGRLHIPTGQVNWERPITYSRVTVLTVTNGVVINTNVLRNIRKEKLKL